MTVQRKSRRHQGMKKSFRETIGRKVGALREARNLTATELAKKAGVSQAQISRLENGLQGFRSDMLLEIALALDVHPRDLVAAWKG